MNAGEVVSVAGRQMSSGDGPAGRIPEQKYKWLAMDYSAWAKAGLIA